MENRERLDTLKKQVEEAKEAKAKAEANLETYQKQREEIIKEMSELGVAPDNIEDEIKEIDKAVEENLDAAEQLLNGGVEAEEGGDPVGSANH